MYSSVPAWGIRHGTSIYPQSFRYNQKGGFRQQAACFEGEGGVFLPGRIRSVFKINLVKIRYIEQTIQGVYVLSSCSEGVCSNHYGYNTVQQSIQWIVYCILMQ